ncbi:MAG: lytic transglycosylase domain-containing protein, partial [Ginsengibacter sp.]
MKTIQSKSLLTLIIILFIIGFSTSAENFIKPGIYNVNNPGDSTDESSHRDMYLIYNPNRVLYPENLEEYRENSQDYIKRYSVRERSYIIHMLKKGQKYFPQALDIFDKYGVPHEFQVLPALESNWSAHAVSPAGAVGYWQFMSTLAREYGLKIGGANDERKNFTKATHAAAKFFRDQLDYFDGDILLTVAAYNCGPGRVRSSIKRSKVKDANFYDIKDHLPAETRRFVNKFISLNVIATNYENFIAKNLDFSEPHLLQIAATDSMVLPDYSVSRNAL